jgi:hypothetical protein
MVLLQGAGRAKPIRPAPKRAARKEPAAAGARADTVVEVHDLNRRFGKFVAVDHVNFSVKRGRFSACSDRTEPARPRRFACSAGSLPPREAP